MIFSLYSLTHLDFKSLRITDIYSIHRIVYDLFPRINNDVRDFLFVEKEGDWQQKQILILSHRMPSIPKFGKILSKEISDNFLHSDYYGFEIKLNPTKRDHLTKKDVPILGKENLYNWFLSKSQNFGFEVITDSLQIQDTGVVIFNKDATTKCTHNYASFIGKLKVINRENFIKSFKMGIGGAKHLGFGLLQVIPLQI